MSRTKKSRTPVATPTRTPREKKSEMAEAPEKRSRKHKGKVSGNRQKEAYVQKDEQASVANKDPRLGNKKPIDLMKAQAPVKAPKPARKSEVDTILPNKANKKVKTKAEHSPIAAIRQVELSAEEKLADELDAIEQDERLLAIIGKQDDEIDLSENEVDYFNDKMDRHQELREALGLDDEEEYEEDDNNTSSVDAWDKLDNSDLSDFK
jgi:ribosome assembly protein YihI (activator of Der GTPase)